MKTDLDALMAEQNLDALLITGPAQHNPAMVYLTGVAHMGHADLVKRRGSDPVLFYNSMERDEAARTGLPTRHLGEYSMPDLLKQTNGDQAQALALRYQKMLTDLGILSGRMALYGKIEAGTSYAVFSALKQAMPELELVGETSNSALTRAMTTKDSLEVERIRHMGNITVEVVDKVADFLTSHTTRNEVLVKPDGQPLTIGDVKARIDLWMAERGAENPEGTIFATARDAGVPHSSGNPQDVLRLGQVIIFDIYPCEKGGGYFYDFTRTWSLGYATDELMALYEDVLGAYKQATTSLTINSHCLEYQRKVCDFFEQRGHKTIQSDRLTQEGYVHGLGHGIGLHIHERPWFSLNSTDEDRLVPGVVFTIEPGLYYPERGMGVRLEDSIWARPDGGLETLVEYPLDLILPMS